jgi:hypothetical protein
VRGNRSARFGETVRIVSTPETERAGLAGLVGSAVGETQPSASGVSVIGGAADDFALEVHFEERKESHWFPLELVQFVDQEAGTKGWARKETGKWKESDLPRSLWRRFLARLRGRV